MKVLRFGTPTTVIVADWPATSGDGLAVKWVAANAFESTMTPDRTIVDVTAIREIKLLSIAKSCSDICKFITNKSDTLALSTWCNVNQQFSSRTELTS